MTEAPYHPPLLNVKRLSVLVQNKEILHDISFSIYPGEIVGLVGESGSGKSMTASAILGILPPDFTLKGEIQFEGNNLITSSTDMQSLVGARLSLILQDPNLALNPLLTLGNQLIEGLRHHQKMSYSFAFQKGIEWLTKVGISNAHLRMSQYPHEISGGMKQRLLIAMSLICKPSLLIADEPTTALDVTVQAQVLDLLQHLQKEERMSILLITHDLGVIARCCQRVMVMYAGQIIESGNVEQIFMNPQHPYTQALLESRQSLENGKKKELFCLKGSPPQNSIHQTSCAFAPRCKYAMQICQKQSPPLETSSTNLVKCWLPEASRKLKAIPDDIPFA